MRPTVKKAAVEVTIIPAENGFQHPDIRNFATGLIQAAIRITVVQNMGFGITRKSAPQASHPLSLTLEISTTGNITLGVSSQALSVYVGYWSIWDASNTNFVVKKHGKSLLVLFANQRAKHNCFPNPWQQDFCCLLSKLTNGQQTAIGLLKRAQCNNVYKFPDTENRKPAGKKKKK